MSEDNVIRIPIEGRPSTRPDQEGCKHKENTSAECSVTYLEDVRRYVLGVRVWCDDCGRRFRFEKLPVAISMTQPCTSLQGYEATLPIVPGDPTPDQANSQRG